MKKTLLLTLEFPPDIGGIAEYLSGLFGALPAEDVAVLAPGREPLESDRRFAYKVYRRRLLDGTGMPLSWFPSIRHAWRVADLEKAERLVISHLLPMGYVAMILRVYRRLPYVVILHGTDLKMAGKSGWKRFWARKILGRASVVVANSAYTAELAVQFGVPEDKIRIVRPGLAVAAPDVSGRPEAKAKLGLESSKVLLSVGRFVRRKGFDRVISMLPSLREKYGDVRYIVVGTGLEEGNLRSAAQDAGAADFVDFRGAVSHDELADFYLAADIFVLPAREEPNDVEGFGIVCLEAESYGLPVVASRTGGIPEAVADKVTGILVKPNDDEALKAAIGSLLDSPDEAARLGGAGRALAGREATWRNSAAEFRRLFE